MEEREKENEPMIDNLDDVDGLVGKFLSRGKYRPKQYEVEAWGDDGPAGKECSEEETGSQISDLFNQTPEWRQGFVLMLRDCKAEAQVRKCMVFLHSLVKSAVSVMESTDDVIGKSVPFEGNTGLTQINMADWMNVISGLKFTMVSPGTVRNIDYVDITIGSETNKDVLTAFCHFLECMLGLPWTHLKILFNMDEEEGKTVFKTVAMLDAGYGISDNLKALLVRLDSKYPSLLKSLGFLKGREKKLQWQKPFDPIEYNMLFGSLHGLFRTAEETIL